MDITPDTWKTLSRLLDVALDLPSERRAAWLDSLAAPDATFREQLRAILAAHATAETNDFLNTLPKMGGDEPAESVDPALREGALVGPYRLVRALGSGGMGTVWLAERSDGTLKRPVALKLPHTAMSQHQLAERLARERDILAALDHPHIARLYDAGVSETGQPYLALEYVDGEPLLASCDRRRLGVQERLALFEQALAAVQYAHAHLVVHRDLKPANILVTAQGEVKLLDFGIAKLMVEGEAKETELTHLGGRALTPQYASPEQLTGAAIGTASDVYSLGVLLYELLSGALPYRLKRDSRVALEEAILTADPPNPSRTGIDGASAQARGTTPKRLAKQLAGELDTIVLKALKKSPAERYSTVQALSEDIRRHLVGEAVLAQPDSALYRARKFVGRHRLESAAAAAAVLILVGFTVSLTMQVHKVTLERDRADRIAQFMTTIFKISDPSEARAESVTARDLLDNASKAIESGLADDPAMRAQLVRTMSRAYTSLGALDRSEKLLRREYERAGSTLGPDAPETLSVGSELAWLLNVKFRAKDAEALARDILERQRRTLGPDHPATMFTQGTLALALNYLARYDESVPLRRHALEVARRRGKPDDLSVLEHEADLAFTISRTKNGDYAEAERLFRNVVEGYRAKLGSGNLKTITATNGLVKMLSLEKKYDEEEAVLRRVIDDANHALGPDHPRTRDLVNNLIAVLIVKGDLAQAEPMLRELLATNVRIDGDGSPRAAMSKYNLACILARRGAKDEALKLLADAVDHGLIPDAALEMEEEDDLKSLRADPRFQSLVAVVKERYRK